MPFVTGGKYKLRFGDGLDFERLSIQIVPWLWDDANANDYIHITMDFNDVREVINISVGDEVIEPASGLTFYAKLPDGTEYELEQPADDTPDDGIGGGGDNIISDTSLA